MRAHSTPEQMPSVLDHYGIAYRETNGFQKVICPVHDESRPSCSLNLGSGFFECHACGARGGALDIVMAREGVDREAASSFCEGVLGIRDGGVPERAGRKPGSRVFGDEGYQPRYRRVSPARLRRNETPWV